MDYVFKTETIHDLPVHKEFSKGFLYASTPRNILYLIISVILVFYMFQFDNRIFLYGFLVVAGIYLINVLLRNQKKGDTNYRRMLVSNNGKPTHSIIEISEDGILTTERETGNKKHIEYDQFRSIIETERLLILTMQYRLCLILQKSWLQGGTSKELADYLLSHCPNIKRKRVRTTTFGQWVHWIHMAVLIVGTLLALTNIPRISLWDRLSGVLHNEMTYREMADDLLEMDIVISEQTIEELEAYDADYVQEYGEDYYSYNYSESKIFDLLYWEGCGIYDEETWQWTPSSSGVYWLDLELWWSSTIYTDFLRGVSSMNPELEFGNVAESYQDADLEKGSGTVRLSFDYQGTNHQLEAVYDFGWFDTAVLAEVCAITAADANPKNLYFAYDGDGMLLYYGNPDQLRMLKRKTGLIFSNSDFLISN